MFFRTCDRLGEDPRKERRTGARMFAGTLAFGFTDPENGWLETEQGFLGQSGIELWKVRSTGHEIHLAEPAKASYLVPVRGRLDVATPRREHRAVAADALLFSPNTRRTRVEAPVGGIYEAAVVLVPDAVLLSALGPDRRAVPDVEAAFGAAAPHAPDGALRRYLLYLIAELSRGDTPLAAAGPQSHAASLLVDLLAGAMVRSAGEEALEASDGSASLAQVRRAEELMRAHHRDPLSMADIARARGIGQRALQLAFRRHRGASPRAVLQRMRLEEARRRLAVAGEGETVSGIALELGFTHLGRFSVVYRSAFGESPSETRRRGRNR